MSSLLSLDSALSSPTLCCPFILWTADLYIRVFEDHGWQGTSKCELRCRHPFSRDKDLWMATSRTRFGCSKKPGQYFRDKPGSKITALSTSCQAPRCSSSTQQRNPAVTAHEEGRQPWCQMSAYTGKATHHGHLPAFPSCGQMPHYL